MDQRIIKIDENRLPESFTPQEKSMIELSMKRRILLYPAVDAVKEVKNSIAMAHTIAGQKIEPADLAVMAGMVYERMIEVFPEVTLEEFAHAAKKGVYEEYGEYYGLNAKSFLFFVNCYLRSGERSFARAKLSYQPQNEVPAKQMTVGDYKKSILHDYKMFKEMGAGMVAFSAKKYFLLIRKGYIKHVSGDRWIAWLSRGQEYIKQANAKEALKKKKTGIVTVIEDLGKEVNIPPELSYKEFRHLVYITRKLRYIAFFEAMQRQNIENFFEQQE